MINCELCGFSNSPAARTCGKCGSPVNAAPEQKTGANTANYTQPYHGPMPHAPERGKTQPPVYTPPPGRTSTIEQAPQYFPQPDYTPAHGRTPPIVPPPQYYPQPDYTPVPGKTQPLQQPAQYDAHIQQDYAPADSPEAYQPPQHNAPPQTAYRPARADSGPQFDDTPEKPPFPIKKIAIGTAVIALIAGLTYIAILFFGSNANRTGTNSIMVFPDRNRVAVSVNNNEKLIIEGTIHKWQTSLDNRKAAILTGHSHPNGGTLWLAGALGITRVADNVLDFVLADSGNGIAYLKEFDHRLDSATLYLYDTSTQRDTVVSSGAMYIPSSHNRYIKGICISPDGKSVSYVEDYDSRFNEFTGYIKAGNRSPESLGAQTYAVAIADAGKHIYYLYEPTNGRGTSLHVKSGRTDSRLLEEVNINLSFILNENYTEAVFSDLEGRSFITRNGGDRELLDGSAIRWLILPDNVSDRSYYTPHFLFIVNGIRSFKEFLAVTEQGLAYYDGSLSPVGIPGASGGEYDPFNEDMFISANGKTFIFANISGHLISLNPADAATERKELARNVSRFVVTGNANTVYYLDSANTLWCIKTGDETPIRVAENADPQSLALNGNRLFFLTDYNFTTGTGILNYSENGGAPVRITGADNVTETFSTPSSVFYRTRNNSLFRSDGTPRFEPFHEFRS